MSGISFAGIGRSPLAVKRLATTEPASRDGDPQKADDAADSAAKRDLAGEKTSRRAAQLEALLRGWIAGGAAIVFLLALVLALLRVISLMQLFYIYASISATTILLGFLLYRTRRET